MNILIDAFGGDNAPLEVIRGGAQAVQELGVTVTLVGDEQKIRDCAEENGLPLDGMEIRPGSVRHPRRTHIAAETARRHLHGSGNAGAA